MRNLITVTHFRKKCISCGACALEAPQTWVIDKEDGMSNLQGSINKGQFFVGKIHSEDLSDNIRAERNCPVSIIKIIQ